MSVFVFLFLNMNYISILCVKRISFKNLGKTKLDPVPLTCQKQCIKSPGKDPTVCCLLLKRTTADKHVKCTMSNHHGRNQLFVVNK